MEIMKFSLLKYLEKQVWAIKPEMMDTINEILYLKYFTDVPSEERLKNAALLKAKQRDESSLVGVKNNVRVIPVYGVIGKRMNFFMDISGGVSTELLKKDIQAALNDPDVESIVLDVDSPGGTIDGTKEVADFIFESRGTKPIVAYANGLMASGALYIGAAADKITAYNTTEIGSIGVYSQHMDMSKAYEERGIKSTIIRSGNFKAVPNRYEPMTKEVHAYVQEMVDKAYKMFVEDLSRYRGVDEKKIREEWGDGKTFFAQEAKNIGLIDEIKNLDDTIKMAGGMGESGSYKIMLEGDEGLNTNKISFDEKDKIKEEKEMEQFKKDLEALQGQVTELQTANKEKDSKIEDLTKRLDEAVVENKRLDKELTITRGKLDDAEREKIEKAEQIEADQIADGVFKESTLDDKFYSKVKALVNHKKYRTEDGKFDKVAYTEALKAEVTDWEKQMRPSGDVGVGIEKEISHGEISAYGDENKELVSQCE